MALRWGIVSAGLISHDFVNAVGTLPKSEHKVLAVAAQKLLPRALEFATRHGIPRAYEGYEALAKDPEIEVVYIGALNPQHMEIILLMLDHGKNVLCEKPMCMNEKQVKVVVAHAKKKQLFLMESMWSRFFPSYQYLKERIRSGSLGTITELDVSFGCKEDHLERVTKKALGGGTIIELGFYTIQASLWVFRGQEPISVEATGTLNDDGCDMDVKGVLRFKNDGLARISASTVVNMENTMRVKGTKGEITIPSFWAPQSLIDADGTVKEWPLPNAKFDFNYPNSCGLRYEADEVWKCIRSGTLQSVHASHEDSLAIARIGDELRRQLGVVYSCD